MSFCRKIYIIKDDLRERVGRKQDEKVAGGVLVFIENEDEEEEMVKKDIVFDYCKVRPNSALAIIEEEMGVDVAVKMIDLFQGTIISIPTRDALRRSIIPMNIQRHLFALSEDSDVFKKRVKQLSKIYKLPKRAIIEMNQKGVYSR